MSGNRSLTAIAPRIDVVPWCDAMEAGSVKTIVRAFNANGVRYLIAGGLAVVAHGYVRFTADMDLIIDLERQTSARR